MTYQIYHSAEEQAYTIIDERTDDEIKKDVLELDAVLVTTITGKDNDECMTKVHTFLEWAPYIPQGGNNEDYLTNLPTRI